MRELNDIYDLSKSLNESDYQNILVISDPGYNRCIYLSIPTNTNDYYFKIYDNCDISKSKKSCRVKISKAKYKKCNDSYREFFELSKDDKQWLMKILSYKYPESWNMEYETVWEFIIMETIRMSKVHTKDKYGDRKVLKYLNKIPNYMNLN